MVVSGCVVYKQVGGAEECAAGGEGDQRHLKSRLISMLLGF